MKSVKGLFRVFGLATVLLVGATGFTLHRAEAHLNESLRGFGEQLAAIDGFVPNTAPRQLFVNGLEVKVVALSTGLGVKDALDRFQSTCHAVANIDLPATLQQKFQEPQGEQDALPAGVIRQAAQNEGFLACLDIGAGTDAEGLLGRLTEFGKTQNLKSLGQMRYALARRKADTTSLLLLWTEGDAKLSELFPAQGDAPGRELADVPRPEGGRRLLSAVEEGMPFGLATYEVQGRTLAKVTRDFSRRLAVGGWRTQPLKKGGIFAEKSGRRLVVLLRNNQERKVAVTISDLG